MSLYDYKYEHRDTGTPEMIEVPCQSCGTMVKVPVNFFGCVFCFGCNTGSSSEHFYPKLWTGSP